MGEHLWAGKEGMCTRPQLREAAEALRDHDGGKAIVIALALGVRESHVGADAGAEVLAQWRPYRQCVPLRVPPPCALGGDSW